jgi:hypothetical protein
VASELPMRVVARPPATRTRLQATTWRKRLFDAAIHSLRLCVERTFAWEDKFKRLLLRFEFKQQRHYGMKLMAYTSHVSPHLIPTESMYYMS